MEVIEHPHGGPMTAAQPTAGATCAPTAPPNQASASTGELSEQADVDAVEKVVAR
jgi:hypothetical protein